MRCKWLCMSKPQDVCGLHSLLSMKEWLASECCFACTFNEQCHNNECPILLWELKRFLPKYTEEGDVFMAHRKQTLGQTTRPIPTYFYLGKSTVKSRVYPIANLCSNSLVWIVFTGYDVCVMSYYAVISSKPCQNKCVWKYVLSIWKTLQT